MQPQNAAGNQQEHDQNPPVPQTDAALNDLASVKWTGSHLFKFALCRDLLIFIFQVGPDCMLCRQSHGIRRLRGHPNRCNQPVSATDYVGDVGGILGIVSECSAQRSDRLVDGIGRNNQVFPNQVEQLIDADDLAGTLREAEEDPHGSGLEFDLLPRRAKSRRAPDRSATPLGKKLRCHRSS